MRAGKEAGELGHLRCRRIMRSLVCSVKITLQDLARQSSHLVWLVNWANS